MLLSVIRSRVSARQARISMDAACSFVFGREAYTMLQSIQQTLHVLYHAAVCACESGNKSFTMLWNLATLAYATAGFL